MSTPQNSSTAPQDNKPAGPMLDLTLLALKTRLEQAQAEHKAEGKDVKFHAGTCIRKTLIRIAADQAGLKPGTKERAHFCQQMDSLPTWMLNGNDSYCRQAYERKGGVGELVADYSKF